MRDPFEKLAGAITQDKYETQGPLQETLLGQGLLEQQTTEITIRTPLPIR